MDIKRQFYHYLKASCLILLALGITVGLFSIPLEAKTDPFVLDPYFSYPIFLPSSGNGREVEAVFFNPAGSTGSPTHQVRFSSGSPILGYSHYGIGYLAPFTDWSVSFGIEGFGANDLIHTSLGSNGRPQTGDTFADRYYRTMAAVSFSPQESIKIAVKGGYFIHMLEDDKASFLSLDVGMRWAAAPFFSLGFFTENALHSDYSWTLSNAIEEVSRRLFVEAAWHTPVYAVSLLTDFGNHMISGEYRVSDTLQLVADSVWHGLSDWKRYSLGIVLNLDIIDIYYRHNAYLARDFGSDTDVIGVLFRFGEPIRLGDLSEVL